MSRFLAFNSQEKDMFRTFKVCAAAGTNTSNIATKAAPISWNPEHTWVWFSKNKPSSGLSQSWLTHFDKPAFTVGKGKNTNDSNPEEDVSHSITPKQG